MYFPLPTLPSGRASASNFEGPCLMVLTMFYMWSGILFFHPFPDGSDEDPTVCSSFNCTNLGLAFCPSGKYCMQNGCDICQLIGYNFSFCPDGSDQQQQYCNRRSPDSVCNNQCNSLAGPCPPTPAPVFSPISFPPSPAPDKVATARAIARLQRAVKRFHRRFHNAELAGKVSDPEWQAAGKAAKRLAKVIYLPTTVDYGKVSMSIMTLNHDLELLLQRPDGQKRRVGKQWLRTIKSLMKAGHGVLAQLS